MKRNQVEFIRSAHAEADLIDDGRPEVAFAGRSNVGKSTLINRLLGRDGLARTSSTPGRTQSVNYFLVDERWWCVDLPGYGWARAAKTDRQRWATLMESYLARDGERRRVLLLVDGKVGATSLDCQAAEYLRSLGLTYSVVVTKVDKVGRGVRQKNLAAIRQDLGLAEDEPLVAFSAQSGEGVRELWSHIGEFCAAASGAREAR